MFTGIVEDTGVVERLEPTSSGRRLFVDTGLDLADTKLGDSIAVDGVCLTVVQQQRRGTRWHVAFDADAALAEKNRRALFERAVAEV